MRGVLFCLFAGVLTIGGVMGMNASFYPGIIPDQSDVFCTYRSKFYEAVRNFNINDNEETLELLKKWCEFCRSSYNNKVTRDGGMCVLSKYTKKLLRR